MDRNGQAVAACLVLEQPRVLCSSGVGHSECGVSQVWGTASSVRQVQGTESAVFVRCRTQEVFVFSFSFFQVWHCECRVCQV